MPFLLGDRLAARIDLKSNRLERQLLVRGAWVESGIDRAVVAPALAAELRIWASWLDLNHVLVGARGTLARALRRELSA